MSKELTEQWRNGELKKGLYYIKSKSGRKVFALHTNSASHLFTPYNRYTLETKEVLAPVPTYNQFVELTEKVHILNEANMNLENIIGNFAKQLKEANDALKQIADTRNFQHGHKFAQSYIKKWGIK